MRTFEDFSVFRNSDSWIQFWSYNFVGKELHPLIFCTIDTDFYMTLNFKDAI